jgi:hypothetical protein
MRNPGSGKQVPGSGWALGLALLLSMAACASAPRYQVRDLSLAALEEQGAPGAVPSGQPPKKMEIVNPVFEAVGE